MKQDAATQAAIAHILEVVTIPTLPGVVRKISRLLNDPDAGMPEVAALIVQDASISGKILRMANSAYYALAQPVSSIQQAALVLGGEVLKNIAMQASVISSYDHLKPSRDFDVKTIWKHAVTAAQVAQSLSSQCRVPLLLEPDEFYTCGLLHDIGKIMMVDSLKRSYLKVLKNARQEELSGYECEQQAFGFHHADVGAMLASLWSLPRPMVSAIRFHHGPQEHLQAQDHVLLVSLADQLANAVQGGHLPEAEELVAGETLDRLRLELPEVESIIETAASGWSTLEV